MDQTLPLFKLSCQTFNYLITYDLVAYLSDKIEIPCRLDPSNSIIMRDYLQFTEEC
jgi:hypothetical protein